MSTELILPLLPDPFSTWNEQKNTIQKVKVEKSVLSYLFQCEKETLSPMSLQKQAILSQFKTISKLEQQNTDNRVKYQ